MRKKWVNCLKTVTVATVLCIDPEGVALADGWYSGLAAGASQPDLPSRGEFDDRLFPGAGSTVNSTLDDTGFAWNASFGYRWGAHVAVELGYTGLGNAQYQGTLTGSASSSTVETRSRGVVFSALGLMPVTHDIEVFGLAGIYAGKTRLEQKERDTASGAVTNAFNAKANSESLLVGAGASWSVAEHYALRFEYQRYFDVGDDQTGGEADVDVLTIGILFR